MRILRKTPFLELLTTAVIVSFHALIAPKPRIASDALFIEGVVFSVIGTIIALRISDQVTVPSLLKKQHATTRPTGSIEIRTADIDTDEEKWSEDSTDRLDSHDCGHCHRRAAR